MDNSDQKIQIIKSEVIHDLNNLNYILRTLTRLIDSVPGLPSDIKRLSMGAIVTTDNLIAKLGGNSKTPDKITDEKNGDING